MNPKSKAIKKKSTVDKSERAAMRAYDSMLRPHLTEMSKRKADAYNLGWATGDNFIHSKTSKGRLYSERKGKKWSHTWES